MKVQLLLLLYLLFVSSHSPSSIPNPKKSPESCGLSSNSAVNERWVCDVDSILEKKDVSKINDIVSQTHAQTAKVNPPCAVEIAVVVIKSMDAGYGGSSDGAGISPPQVDFKNPLQENSIELGELVQKNAKTEFLFSFQ